MCGRYSQTRSIESIAKRFGVSNPSFDYLPRYNLAPTQSALVVSFDGTPRLESMRWGLVPYWAKDAAIGNRMINARAETVAEKPSFKQPLARRRCLIPADGFYEWRKTAGQTAKIPMHFALRSQEPFAFAGLWDLWKKTDGSELRSFTIITTEANDLIRPVHERMPVILAPEDEARWIDPSLPVETARNLLRPLPAEKMDSYAVSTLVNSPKNDSPECIKALA